MHKRILTAGFLALALAVGLVGAALADGSITILPGTVTATSSDIDFGSYTYSLSQYTAQGSPAAPWTVTDGQGTGVGWRVTMGASDFTDGGPDVITVGVVAQTLSVSVPGASISCLLGPCITDNSLLSGAPGISYVGHAPGSVTIMRCDPGVPGHEGCPDSGWRFTPNFNLVVPAGLHPATYHSVWTVTASSGPA